MSAPQKNGPPVEIYGRRSPVRRWQLDFKATDSPATFLSPFVTSRTAEKVLSAGDPKKVRLCTVFSALNFIHGASSLKCLRRLIKAGCEVYHVSRLHAKVMLIPGLGCSVGSQNLTEGGNNNLEMTLYIRDTALISEVSRIVDEWVKDAPPITVAMVSDMLETITPFRRRYCRLVRGVDEIDLSVFEREKTRRLATKTRERERRIRILREAAVQASDRSDSKYARVMRASGCTTLFATQGNLLKWHHSGQPIDLDKTFRYLCVIPVPEQARLEWVRVMTTRITKIANGMQTENRLTLRGRPFAAEAKLDW